ncbi:MAG TPA: lanthionine synthetase LanC family protein, partial [Ktedonobacteraceae bacterium]|nr:lanthionine synthetase LanC family protein [Ktedonobacteraceae bacterium]
LAQNLQASLEMSESSVPPWWTKAPGFMTGLAGIGYTFLRLADPESVPSVLTLEVCEPRA